MQCVICFSRTGWNDNTGTRTVTSHSFIGLITVIGSITCEAGDGRSNLLKQSFKLTGIARVLNGQDFGNDFARLGIYRKIPLSPLSGRFAALLVFKPLARAINF